MKSHIAGTDPVAIARTSPNANARTVPAAASKPASGSSYEAWLAYFDATLPGGEFNADFARWEVEAAAGLPLS